MRLSFVTLYVRDIKKMTDFYAKAFSLKTRFVHDSGLYAEMETGNTVLAFAQTKLAETIVSGGYIESSPEHKPANFQLGFEPADVKESVKAALAAGASLVSPYEIKPWGWQAAMLRDPEGNLVELARKLPSAGN